MRNELLDRRAVVQPERIVRRTDRSRFGAIRRRRVHEDQPSGAVRMTGREQDRDRATIHHPEQHRAFRLNRVENCPRVVGPLFPTRQRLPRGTIRGTRTTPIEHDHARMGAETTQVVGVRRPVPPHVHCITRRRREQDVDLAAAEHLVRDAILTYPRVLRLGNLIADHEATTTDLLSPGRSRSVASFTIHPWGDELLTQARTYSRPAARSEVLRRRRRR